MNRPESQSSPLNAAVIPNFPNEEERRAFECAARAAMLSARQKLAHLIVIGDGRTCKGDGVSAHALNGYCPEVSNAVLALDSAWAAITETMREREMRRNLDKEEEGAANAAGVTK